MALVKNLGLMAFSTGMRLLAGVLALAVTARALGAQQFGQLMFWMAVCSLLCVISNFGLGTYLLREVGRDRNRASVLVADALSGKLLLSALLLGGGVLSYPWLGRDDAHLFALLLLALISESFTEFFAIGFRARERFDLDARLAAISSAIYSVLVAVVAWYWGSALAVAWAYVVSRCVVSAIAMFMLQQVLGERVRPSSLLAGWQVVRRTLSYAVDTIMGALFGQIDSVVLQHFSGPVAVGLHQGGMRFFLAGTQAGTVLANVFIPRAAASHQGPQAQHEREKWHLQCAFLVLGVSGGLAFILGGPWFVQHLLGPSFAALAGLTALFGVLFVVRSAVSAWGIVLTVEGGQRYRAFASFGHWLLVGSLAWTLVPERGNAGWLWSLIGGNLLLLAAYVAGVMRASGQRLGNWRMVGVTLLTVLLFLPAIYYA